MTRLSTRGALTVACAAVAAAFVALLCGAINPSTAWGYVDVQVGETYVYAEDAEYRDIDVQEMQGVHFDASTNTLRLENAQLDDELSIASDSAFDVVTIKLVGDNTIKAAADTLSCGIDAWASLAFTGSGNLEIDAAYQGISADGSLSFESGRVIAGGDSDGLYAHYGITVNGGEVGAFGEDSGCWASGSTVSIKSGVLVADADESAIYGENIRVSGGAVDAYSSREDAIYCSKSFKMTDGTITANGCDAGVHAGTTATFSGGDITASTTDDYAIRAQTVALKGAKVTAKATGNGWGAIDASGTLSVSKGTVTASVTSSGFLGAMYGNKVIISGGTVKASAKKISAIVAESSATIKGGKTTAKSTNAEAIYAYKTLTVKSGTVKATSKYTEALGSDKLYIKGGKVTAKSSKQGALWGSKVLSVTGGKATVSGKSNYTDVVGYAAVLASGGKFTYKKSALKAKKGKLPLMGMAKIKSAKGFKANGVSASKAGGVSVKWAKVPGAKGYEFWISTSKYFTEGTTKKRRFSVKSKYGKKRAFKGAGLKKGTTYYIQIRAYNGKRESVWSATKKVKTKK